MFLLTNAVAAVQGPSIGPLSMLLEPLLLLTLCIVLYRGNLVAKLFILMIAYALFFSASSLAKFIIMALLGLSQNALIYNRPLYTAVLCMLSASTLFLALAVRHFHHPQQPPQTQWPWLLLATSFPTATLLFLLLFYSAFPAVSTGFNIWIFCLFIMAVANILVLILVDRFQRQMQKREKLLAVGERARMQEETITALSAAYTAQRKLTHDFKQYLGTLSEMIAQGNLEQASGYLKQVQTWQTTRTLLVNSHNAAIDAILNQKGYLAKQQGIDMRFTVNDLSELKIKSLDCTAVLGNLLDNAMEACKKLPAPQSRWVEVRVTRTPPGAFGGASLFISVVNPSNPVEIQGGYVTTTKPGSFAHGFGLPNVQDILKKYNAEYVLSYDNGKFLFSSEWPDIPL
ncbi:MAG: ATP-binding protein [Pygmaiobacter sp.]|nr:ATP-binding protein [Pygmaiobacter sp.]